jgi:hypothetical protein
MFKTIAAVLLCIAVPTVSTLAATKMWCEKLSQGGLYCWPENEREPEVVLRELSPALPAPAPAQTVSRPVQQLYGPPPRPYERDPAILSHLIHRLCGSDRC